MHGSFTNNHYAYKFHQGKENFKLTNQAEAGYVFHHVVFQFGYCHLLRCNHMFPLSYVLFLTYSVV